MFRTITATLLALIASLALMGAATGDTRSFQETGYSISNAKFADFFNHRGGIKALGYPISREFDFLGARVQFLQRAVLQQRPDGGVGLLNVLDEGLLPYTHINGSIFPGVDPAVVAASPSPADPEYASKALEFIRANAPDEFEGKATNFYSTFLNTVTYQDAFPAGDGEPALVPLINLEMWGLPTSRPTYDPNNGNFIYVRFQRGIMHFDATSGVTQGILVGDLLKSVITGQNLPLDLDQEARGSRLYRQYDNNVIGGVARPAELPATNMFAAFERDGVVVPVPQPSPTPVPPTPVPAATSTPVPPPTPAPPASIQIQGSPWFIDATNGALKFLADDAPDSSAFVKQWVYRILETPGIPSVDAPNRTLYVTEAAALPQNWRCCGDEQQEWYAGLLVHNATHIEQAANGRPSMGPAAEQEAYLKQKDAVRLMDTTENPGSQFVDLLNDIINGTEASWNHWANPRNPGPKPTATPTS